MRSWLAAMLLGLLSTAALAQQTPSPNFTPEEKAWIAAHPVVNVAIEPNWAPIEYSQDGQYKGLSSEYLRAVGERSGLRFNVVPQVGWDEFPAKLKRHEVDLLPAVAQLLTLPSMTPLIDVTSDYYVGATVVVTGAKAPVVFDLAQLDGKTIAIKGGGSYQAYLQQQHPNIRLLLVRTPEDALKDVILGNADAAVGPDAALLPYLRRKYDGQLHVSGVIAQMPYELGMGVRKDLPLLRSIIDKSLETITAKESDEMDAQWLENTDYGAPSLSVLIRYYRSQIILALISLLVIVGMAIYARRLQRIAERSEREKAMFLAVMSHEIRSPMNAILASVELLQKADLPLESRRLTEVASVGAESLLRLLDDVLDISKLEAGQVRLDSSPVAIIDVIRGITDLLSLKAREKGITLAVAQPSPIDCWLMLDRLRVEQVLYNIVSNAVKFTAQGTVTVTAWIDDLPEQKGATRLHMQVADTGIGIDATQQERLFRPYAQASVSTSRTFGGTGLGLVICRNLIDLMGGVIGLQSKPGVGTTITIDIPCEAVPLTSPVQGTESTTRPIAGAPLQVLLVEDTVANQIVLRAQLKQLGCHPELAVDGAKALLKLHQNTYHVVILDCDLPDISGYEVARRWRAHELESRLPPTPILALSGSTDTDHIAACFESGMDTVLHKPIKLAKLRDALVVWCEADLEDVKPDTPEPEVSPAMIAKELTADVLKLRLAWNENDISLALHYAHRLSGSASVLNLPQLAKASHNLETQLRTLSDSTLPPSDNALSEVETLLNEWINLQGELPNTARST